MPGAEHTGVIMMDDGQPRTLARTDAVADQVTAVQFDVGDGLVFDVLIVDDYLKADDLATDPRWPQFGRRAVESCGIRSMVSYRLSVGRRRGAVVSFYSAWPYAFDEVAGAIGAMFAAYCSLALITAALGDEVHPHRAARVQREIGVAAGILMATGQLSIEEAFAQLQRASRRLHRDLRELARHVTATGQLPNDPDDPRPP